MRAFSQGRADDGMNLGGIMVSPLELERIIDVHPAVYESTAVAIHTPIRKTAPIQTPTLNPLKTTPPGLESMRNDRHELFNG